MTNQNNLALENSVASKINQLQQMTHYQLFKLSQALDMGDVSQLTQLELLEQITFNTEAFRPSKFDVEHIGKLIDAATTSATNNTVKTATEIVEAIAAGNKPVFTADKKATELALRTMRLKLLEELATFKDMHLLAFMNVLCDGLTDKASTMQQMLARFEAATTTLSPQEVGCTLSLIKVCQSRLSGNQEGLRLQ